MSTTKLFARLKNYRADPKHFAIAISAIFVVDSLTHDFKWYCIKRVRSQIRKLKQRADSPYGLLLSENVDTLRATNNQSYKINIVNGPKGVGKSNSLASLVCSKSEEKRPTFILRIGKIGTESGECDLAEEIYKQVGVATRNSFHFTVKYNLLMLIQKLRGLAEPESVAPQRIDYAVKLLFDAVQDIFADEQDKLNHSIYIRRPKDFVMPTNDYDTCRPVVVIDEGDDCEVSTPGHDQLRKEIARKFIKKAIAESSRHKNFELFITGSDTQLIEELTARYKSEKFPITHYNPITLCDPSVGRLKSVVSETIMYDSAGNEVRYDQHSVSRIVEVLGTRVGDLAEGHLLTRHSTPEELEGFLRLATDKAGSAITSLISECGDEKDKQCLVALLNKLTFSKKTSVSVAEVPASVRNSSQFTSVFYALGNDVSLQRPVLKAAWSAHSLSDPKKGWWF